ncbi:MAG: bifunctional (p)ppGpp synthetase/guanosine-3',5'-bis(diphosphate) 3'-pyrophosphohydrolase [Pseudomonadota bacterium]
MAGLSAAALPTTSSEAGGMRRQDEHPLTSDRLIDRVLDYQPDADVVRLERAFEFARTHHGEQKRASGDPYYFHPVAVAGLLTQVRLDEVSIIAGLLHDVVEDTDVGLDEVETLFGRDVRDLVDGVTKLTRLEYRSEETKQAENFQKFILATVDDVRVLLVKLADRLHNMRTLGHLKEHKRVRIARETMEIYAPLARRVGLYHVASELEDRSFEQLNPDARAAMRQQLEQLETVNKIDLDHIRQDLMMLMEAHGVSCRIKGRRKTPYSIWRKLERKEISFRDVADIFAFRIIVSDHAAECYRVLGILHTEWACLPDRFRDFISVPKPNGYQSLHTTVRASGNRRVELQVRTEHMDDTAENGVAAHWGYKNSHYGFDADAARKSGLDAEANLRAFAELLEHEGDPDSFLEHAKLEMYREHVFCFTPKGRLIRLPSGSMPLDFAYAVHTAIGDTCTGVRINGTPRSLRTELENGDVVDIVRAKSPPPVQGREALTTTGRARSAIRRLGSEQQSGHFRSLGVSLIQRDLRRAGFDPVDVRLEGVAQKAGFESIDDLHEQIGRGVFTTLELIESAFPGHEKPESPDVEKTKLDDDHASQLVAGDVLKSGVTLHLGTCCLPIPGDRIIGIREAGRGLVVHSISCMQLETYDSQPELWEDLEWTELAKTGAVGVARIRVTAINQRGVLATLCSAVAQANGNITAIATDRRAEEYIDILIDIEVEDNRRLAQILAALRALVVVDRASREQGQINAN